MKFYKVTNNHTGLYLKPGKKPYTRNGPYLNWTKDGKIWHSLGDLLKHIRLNLEFYQTETGITIVEFDVSVSDYHSVSSMLQKIYDKDSKSSR